MRLVCPNCGAQYEVDDRVMPENGRDVQCSNCGHAWFQLPPSAEPEEPETPSPFDDIDELDGDDVEGTPEDTADDAIPEDDGDERGDDESQADDEDGTTSEADPEPQGKAARGLDDGVRSILQEEAEHELKAREAERESLETQTDLGLDEAPATRPDIRVVDQEEQIESEDLKGRDVLPDIEEINSTLDAPEDGAEVSITDDDIQQESKSGGFRRGFVLVVVLACLLAILYIFAPAIGERVPALQPILEQYIDIADRVRVALEDMMRTAISKMQGLIDKPENG